MALIALLAGSTQVGTKINRIFSVPQPDGSTQQQKFLSFILDATTNENFQKEVEPTNNPVEQGVDITDHAIIRPEKLTIEGIMSESPLSAGNQLQGLATSVAAAAGTALAGPLAGVVGSIGGGFGGKTLAGLLGLSDRKLTDLITELTNLIEARLPIEIVTGLKVYQNFILTSFQYTRTPQIGRAINVSLNFQQIRFANSTTVRVKLPKPNVSGAQSTQNKQEQTPTDPNSAQQQKSSLLLKGFQGLGLAK